LLDIIVNLGTDFYRQWAKFDESVRPDADRQTEFIRFPVVLDVGGNADVREGRRAIPDDVLKIRKIDVGTINGYGSQVVFYTLVSSPSLSRISPSNHLVSFWVNISHR
jgi:hypothetical protein